MKEPDVGRDFPVVKERTFKLMVELGFSNLNILNVINT